MNSNNLTLNKIQIFSLVLLRTAIGWHLLYEGLTKLIKPGWSAAGFLMESKWIFSGLFKWMANDPTILSVVNQLNIWGLILIGLGLIMGALTPIACFAGVLLMMLYYFSTPPFIGLYYSIPMEGSYLIVNKNLIEALALLALGLIPTGKIFGLDYFIAKWRQK